MDNILENGLKQFKIPCKLRYEELCDRHSDLTISFKGKRVLIKRPNPFVRPKDVNSKPGTAGSLQALNATKSRNIQTRKRTKVRSASLNCYGNVIDTKHIVDTSFVAFLPEFCQRARYDQMPADPLDVCRKFTLQLEPCDLQENDEGNADQ